MLFLVLTKLQELTLTSRANSMHEKPLSSNLSRVKKWVNQTFRYLIRLQEGS